MDATAKAMQATFSQYRNRFDYENLRFTQKTVQKQIDKMKENVGQVGPLNKRMKVIAIF